MNHANKEPLVKYFSYLGILKDRIAHDKCKNMMIRAKYPHIEWIFAEKRSSAI